MCAPPPLRDAEVLSLFAAIINKLKALVDNDVPRIFEAVFEVRGGVGERWEGVGGERGMALVDNDVKVVAAFRTFPSCPLPLILPFL